MNQEEHGFFIAVSGHKQSIILNELEKLETALNGPLSDNPVDSGFHGNQF